MKILHLHLSEPNETINILKSGMVVDNENIDFDLTPSNPDYDRLLALIFATDKTVIWP